MTDIKIPELFYYAENMMAIGNFDSIDPHVLQKVHQSAWEKNEPLTKAQNSDTEINPLELRDGLLDLINHVRDNVSDNRLPTLVGDFFMVCVRSGYKNFQEIIDDTKIECFTAGDLQEIFFKFIHPALVKMIPDDYKPEELCFKLDDAGVRKEKSNPPSQRPLFVGRTRQP